jgi:hypothetical protein
MSKDRLVFNVHPGQKEVMHFKSRFKVIVAGRRWGKSKLAAVSLVQAAASRAKSLVWYVAPTYGMCKSIMWLDLIEIIPKKWIRKSNETIQFIELVNGSRIELKGCDKPDSLRGVGLHFLVIDEAQDIKKETWTTVLRPTLSDKQGGALIIGTPKGFNWLYDVYQEGQKPVNRKNGLWASWQFPTMTSPFIPPEEIEAAKRDMDEKVFNQEFNACHLPNTQVRLFDGTSKAISELKAGDKLNYLNDSGVLEEIKVLDGGYTGVKDIIEVTLENGETFSASYNHKVKNTELGQVQLKDAEYLEYTPIGIPAGSRAEYYWLKNRYVMSKKQARNITNQSAPFVEYEEWLAQRWNKFTRTLKLLIIKKELKPQQEVYNIKVSSPDSSYVLDSGLLNYNCFETMTGRVYFPFDRRIHTGSMYKFVPNKPIFVGMDFNVTPMTAVILQPQYNGELWAVDEIFLYNSSTTEMADEIERRYWRYMNQISIFPDPAANYRNSSRGETDIDILRQKGFKKIYFRKKHPAVQDRINAVNKMLKSADSTVRLFINDNCKHLIDSFEQTLYKENSKEVDKTQNKEHITDAIGYCIEYTNPVRSNIHIAMSI